MGNRAGCKIIWGVPLQDSDWRDGDSIRPKWLPLAKEPDYAQDGFGDVFWPMPGTDGRASEYESKTVDMHNFDYCGDYESKTTFIGVVLWRASWFGESPALEPTDEQREAVGTFLASVGFGRAPAVHALLSYG